MYKHFIFLALFCLINCSTPKNDNMIFIEGGTFQMGDIWGDSQRKDDKPAHNVTVDNLYISKYEVTFEEFLEFLNDTDGITENGKSHGYQIVILDSLYCPFPLQSPFKLENNSFHFRGNKIANNIKCPAISMTWIGTIEFCNWKSKQDDLTPCYTLTADTVICDWKKDGYRLPTEAEWEYAAGGGSSTKQKYAGTDVEENLNNYI